MTNQPDASVAGQSRVVRVFVSSTFRDMHAERDELVKRIFPRLRKLCGARGVTFAEIDLRWGITDEQAAEGKVLPICLAEIERCRPYFVGLIGQRYGWIPEDISPDLCAQQPWLAEHRRRSVTELEILHGVLNDTGMARHAFFYFRSRDYLARVPPAARADYEEVASPDAIAPYSADEAAARAGLRRQQLEDLKARIRASGCPVREDYPDPVALGEMVFADLARVIDQRFPGEERLDPLDRDTFEHNAFAQNRVFGYVPRESYLGRLDAHVAGENAPLVITGAPGVGKSALAAWWVLHYRKFAVEQSPAPRRFWQRRTRSSTPYAPLVVHFVAAGNDSADIATLLRRLIGELHRHVPLRGEAPEDPQQLSAAFARVLVRAAAKRRVVLVIDGLDQLEDRHGALDLTWMPEDIPSKIRMIVSCGPGRTLDILARRGWPSLTVESLNGAERGSVAEHYLSQYTKTLAPVEVGRLERADAAANPLFLRVVLDELRLHGDYLTLGQRLTHYLGAATIEDLYDLVLARYEADYDRDRPHTVRDSMVALWAARRGLAEAELLDLLGTADQPMPRAWWSPLFLAAESSLLVHSGRLTFAQEGFRRAIARRYLEDDETRKRAHLSLAEYFEHRDLDARVVEELPWQLRSAGAYDRLAALLAQPAFLVLAWEVSSHDVRELWADTEANSPFRLEEVYEPVINGPISDTTFAWNVALLLESFGRTAEAVSLQWRLIGWLREQGNTGLLTGALGNLANTFVVKGSYDEALPLLTEQEQLARRSGDSRMLAHCLVNLGRIAKARSQTEKASAYVDEAVSLARKDPDQRYLAYWIGNQGGFLAEAGDSARGLELLREQERICRELDDQDGLLLSLYNQAYVAELTGDLDAAANGFARATELALTLGDALRAAGAIHSRGAIARARGDAESALALGRQEASLRRQLKDHRGLMSALGLQTLVYRSRGQFAEALECLVEAEAASRSVADPVQRRSALTALAGAYVERGDQGSALPFYEELERICREQGDREALQSWLGIHAGASITLGRLFEAIPLLQEKEQLCREIGEADGLVTALANQASLLASPFGRLADALTLAEEALRVAEGANLANRVVQMEALVARLTRSGP